MITLGNNEMTKAFLGSTEVKKICLGSEQVWPVESALPYDAEIEYLRSTGNGQYIDTGIPYDSSLVVDAKLKLRNTAGGNYMFGIYTTINDVAQRWALNANTSARVRPHFGTVTSVNASFSRNAWHIIQANYRYLTIDNNVTDTKAEPFTPTSDINLFIYCRNNNNNGADTFREVDVEYFKITKNNILVRDYIPVRVGTTGYLYDKVSRQLFGNAGTGSFVLGNDVN